MSDGGIYFHLVDFAEEHDELVSLDKSVRISLILWSYKAG
jgi:hypothetical protein